MKIKTKEVFYCEHCKKHGLVRHHIVTHEMHCTANPKRKCRLCDILGTRNDIPALVEKYKALATKEEWGLKITKEQVDALAKETEGCPICMLSVLRISGLKYGADWDYKAALAEIWRDIHSENQHNYY